MSAWRLVSTIDPSFSVVALGEALNRGAPLLPEVRDPNRDARRQRSPRHDVVVGQLIPYATEPVQALTINSKKSARPRLGCQISNFQIFQTPDPGSVLTGMGQLPESLMSIEEPPSLTFHERQQHSDLGRPNTLTGMIARSEHAPQRVPRQPFGTR